MDSLKVHSTSVEMKQFWPHKLPYRKGKHLGPNPIQLARADAAAVQLWAFQRICLGKNRLYLMGGGNKSSCYTCGTSGFSPKKLREALILAEFEKHLPSWKPPKLRKLSTGNSNFVDILLLLDQADGKLRAWTTERMIQGLLLQLTFPWVQLFSLFSTVSLLTVRRSTPEMFIAHAWTQWLSQMASSGL